jgi:hypothetical protein
MVVCVNYILLLKVVRDYFWTLNVAGDTISIVISVSSFVGLAQQGASCILGVNKALHITTIVFVATKDQVGSVGRHQDRTKEVREMERQEQLNVRAADLATEVINNADTHATSALFVNTSRTNLGVFDTSQDRVHKPQSLGNVYLWSLVVIVIVTNPSLAGIYLSYPCSVHCRFYGLLYRTLCTLLHSESLEDGSRLTIGSRVFHPFDTKSLSSASDTRFCVTTVGEDKVLSPPFRWLQIKRSLFHCPPWWFYAPWTKSSGPCGRSVNCL